MTPHAVAADLTIGATLPAGARIASVTLDGRPVPYTVADTHRGREAQVDAGRAHTARPVVTAPQPGVTP